MTVYYSKHGQPKKNVLTIIGGIMLGFCVVCAGLYAVWPRDSEPTREAAVATPSPTPRRTLATAGPVAPSVRPTTPAARPTTVKTTAEPTTAKPKPKPTTTSPKPKPSTTQPKPSGACAAYVYYGTSQTLCDRFAGRADVDCKDVGRTVRLLDYRNDPWGLDGPKGGDYTGTRGIGCES